MLKVISMNVIFLKIISMTLNDSNHAESNKKCNLGINMILNDSNYFNFSFPFFIFSVFV